jgi:peptide/nickel transport system substrate-binding protein
MAQKDKNLLTIGVGRDFYDGPDSRSFLHGSTNTWEGLTYLDENLRATPWLAESWQARDNQKTWIFKLRDKVYFHDKTLLTAGHVKKSLERIWKNPKYDPTGNYRQVIGIEARDDHTIIVRTKEPCPNLPNLLAYYSSPVLKTGTYDEKGRIKELIATGPFMAANIRPGQYVELKAFEDYWGKKPVYQKVVFKSVIDAQTRLMALMAGEVDAVADVGAILPEQAGELEAAPNIKLKKRQVATTHYLLFNCGKEPFNNQDCRHWLAGVLNREEMVDVLAEGTGHVAKSPFTPLAKDWVFQKINTQEGKRRKPALQRPLIILLHGGTLQRWPYLSMAQVLQQKLSQKGVKSNIKVLEAGGFFRALNKGAFDLALQPNTLMTGDPDFFYTYYFASTGARNTGLKDSLADSFLQRARTETDFKKRQNLYEQVETRFNQVLPLLPLYHEISLYGHGPMVAKFDMDHNFRPCLTKARPKP